jgi:hypothetical protein
VRRNRKYLKMLKILKLMRDRFFHENVGQSVWGLAIHEQSRLIAVSSNAREVTLFIFGFIQDALVTYEEDGEIIDNIAKSKTIKFPEFCDKDRLGMVLLNRK